MDLDTQSLNLAQKNAKKHRIAHAIFLQKDAWNLNIQNEYDIITSNGLNIYESDDDKVLDLYKQFHAAL